MSSRSRGAELSGEILPLIQMRDGRMRVVAVDTEPDHLHDLRVLFDLVTDDIELAAAATSMEEGSLRVAETLPDIVVVDTRSLRGNGLPLMRAVRERFPAIRLIVLAASYDPADVRLAMALGARGYLARASGAEELVAAIRAVQAGKVVLTPTAAEMLLDDTRDRNTRLTTEELWILSLLAQGMPEAEAARQIAVSVSTLKRQLQQIVKKLGGRNRIDAIVRAVRRGLI